MVPWSSTTVIGPAFITAETMAVVLPSVRRRSLELEAQDLL